MEALEGVVNLILGTSENDKHGKNNRTMADLLHEVAVKEADQMSPLLVYRLPLHAQLALIIILLLTFWVSFTYVFLDNLLNCNTQNGCLVCSVTNNPSGSCTELSQSSLPMSSSCVSFAPLNVYSDFDLALTANLTEVLSDLTLSGISNDFLVAFDRHREVWECFNENELGQLTTPVADCISETVGRNFLYPGYSLLVSISSDSDTEKYLIGAGIVMLQGAYTLSAIIHYANEISEAYNTSTSFYLVDSVTGVEWQFFQIYECTLSSLDGNFGLISPEANQCDTVTPLTSPRITTLAIPSNYAISTEDYASVNYNVLQPFPMEALLYSGDITTPANIGNDVKHCTYATNLANSYSTYETGLYRCCTESTLIEILSQGQAFASFLLTLGVVATTVVFYLFQRKYDDDFGTEVDSDAEKKSDSGNLQEKRNSKIAPAPIPQPVAWEKQPQQSSSQLDNYSNNDLHCVRPVEDVNPVTAMPSIDEEGGVANDVSSCAADHHTVAPRRTARRMGSIEENRRRRSSIVSNSGL